jgi:hypothetical protein
MTTIITLKFVAFLTKTASLFLALYSALFLLVPKNQEKRKKNKATKSIPSKHNDEHGREKQSSEPRGGRSER